ncbi:RNA exonuclease 5 isoform X1 [Dendroctonus ponderosae]|uniref:Exonuclease domain-containing protein n=2 Tax=Dendroctonus ponderosae TaxID=77166 RepID=U4UN26_DENPD|nr:RNA exonuclease 5 isoform X1 [Dendroctonus ponderosae]ERL93858.1 hypothetical protein D910_11144 [Dendroctonus ponderosae]KAH1028184.1 hypothetical protein HUJ05_001561 [Dendroctonus ponderosae]
MTGPLETSPKKRHRIENKKKKMAALLDIVKLNETDRLKVKNSKSVEVHPQRTEQINGDGPDCNGQSPNKKLKTDVTVAFGPSGRPLLEGDELLQLKKMLQEKTKKIRQMPKFRLRDMGENASLQIPLESRCPLFLSDIQHLLMYSQIGVHSPYCPTRWCHLEKYNHLTNVTLLIVENMSVYNYEAFESYFPFTSANFEHKLEMISPYAFNSNIIKELSMVPLSMTQMRKLITEYGTLEEAAKHCSEVFDTVNNLFPIDGDFDDEDTPVLSKKDKYSRTQLLLSGWQMIEENFPLPIKGLVERKYSDYTLTKDRYRNVSARSPLIAIDCEMCRTDTGDLELTRISAVNEQHEVIYDTLVKPKNKIVDYLTRFSGINAKMMKTVRTDLQEVQNKLRKLLPEDAILIGQSLSNDLHALKMMHPYVIDTSVIYNLTGDRARKTKLQILASQFLDEKIQAGNHGHCSSEDSLACMKLVQLKLRKNRYYGDAVMNSIYVKKRSYPDMGDANYAISMFKQCVKNGNTVNIVAVADLVDQYKVCIDKDNKNIPEIKCVKVESNKNVIKHLCKTMNNSNLNLGHIRIASEHASSEKTFKTVDKWIKELHKSAEHPALLAVMLSGCQEGGNGTCFLHLKKQFIS